MTIVPGYTEGARPGPYDYVFDFGESRALLRGLVPEGQRLTENIDGLTVLDFRDPTIRQAMDAITVLANSPSKSSKNPLDRQEYRDNLEHVYNAMAKEALAWTGGKDTLILSPKMGGVFVQQVFEQAGFKPEDFYDYRMSRVHRNDGRLMVVTTLGENNPEVASCKRFMFADDCLASDISAFGTLEMIKEALTAKKIPLSEAAVLITVSAATQRGVESLLSQKTNDYFGFGSIKIVTGILVHKMNDDFYLQHPDGRFVVGDMGDWTKPATA